MKTGKRKRPKKLRQPANTVVAAVVGAVLVIGLTAVIASARQPVPQSEPAPVRVASDHDTILVAMPTRAIAKGEKLGAVTFAKVGWPKDKLSGEFIINIDDFENAVALSPLPANLPIPVTAVSKAVTDVNAVVEGIPEGFRAITVRVDAESAVEGWARTGNHVDVIVLRQSKEGDDGIEAKVIAENVRILSAGRSTEPLANQSSAPAAPATVTLLVSQEDALKIKTAQTVGRLTFSLRGMNDKLPTVSVAMNQRVMLGAARPVLPKKERYRGQAKGPDGKTYVLGEDSRWIKTGEQVASATMSTETKSE